MKRYVSILAAVLVLFVLLTGGAGAQELILYSMCPPRSLDWSSPRGLALGAIGNQFTFIHRDHKHAIGHVFVELKNGDEREMAGSVPTGDSNSDKNMIFKDGFCLGILFADIKGRLETAVDLDPQIPDRYKSGRIAFISFKLSAENYTRVKTYLSEYRRRGYDRIYNGLNRPREGLGAGCSGFGVSCIEVAGLLHPVWKDVWAQHVLVPMDLIGGPIGGGKKVFIGKAITRGRWANEKESNRRLDLYDPDLIYKWVHAAWKKESAKPTGNVRLLQRGKALGLEYDCTRVPTPTEPIFQVANPQKLKQDQEKFEALHTLQGK